MCGWVCVYGRGERAHVRAYPSTGWLRLVGALKSYVSFAKIHSKRDQILQKRYIILRSLLIVATPLVDDCAHTLVYRGQDGVHTGSLCTTINHYPARKRLLSPPPPGPPLITSYLCTCMQLCERLSVVTFIFTHRCHYASV